jgi:hypothetical protein
MKTLLCASRKPPNPSRRCIRLHARHRARDGHDDADSFLQRDEVIQAHSLLGGGELDTLQDAREQLACDPGPVS